jgi:type IV pilus assembly protein PilO
MQITTIGLDLAKHVFQLHGLDHPRRPVRPGGPAGEGGTVKAGRRSTKKPAGGKGSSSRAVLALAVMGALVLLHGWTSLFLAPKAAAKEQVQRELAAARRAEDDLRRNLAELRKLANDTSAREAELARLGRLVPADPDVAGAILALDDTARQAQVAMSSLLPAPPVPAAGAPTSVSMTMHVSGTFGQIFDYLRRLELLDRLVVVDSIQLTGAPGVSGSPKIEADVKARMFAAGTASPAAATTVAATATASPSASSALPKAGG